MRRHLQEEEDTALTALRQEQERQSHLLTSQRTSLTKKLSPVNDRIQQLEKLQQTPTRDFLLMLRPRAGPSGFPPPTGQMQDQAVAPLPTGLMVDQTIAPLPTGLMVDQTKVLGNLDFRVWRRLKLAVQNKPFFLDPNTANPWLRLSEDLSGVTYGDTYQHQLPEIPERFSKYPMVLGSVGFSSGTHQWDVKVGDHPDWVIGVAKESVDRKGEISVSPENGIWCLFHRDGKYTNGSGELLTVKKSPEKIRVRLDYGRGTVSFYDTDPMTLLYTHTHTFTEKMFPYFSIVKSEEAQTKEIRISETPYEG
uniref:B30.2/SPRY domain-containing protein n=1 Tax=Knipowitschia caucasica TaxID=637954 RepID=A0AAV2KXN7_KNICA